MADRASQSSDALNLELAQLLSKKAGKRLRTTNRFAAFTPLEYQRDWFSYPEPIGALILPNQSGKSTIGAIKTLTGCLGVAPAAISGKPMPPRWPMGLCAGKKYAAAGATFQTITERTILPKLREYMSDDMLVKTRRKQGFETTFHFVSGASLVLMSYEQRVKDFEGGNFDGFWFDEPPPKDIFYAVRRGQMATHGWALITATPLTEPWMLDDLILPSQSLACAECSGGDTPHAEIVSEQPNHGLVYVPEPIDMCSNCRQCNGGYLDHNEIQSFLASITDDAQRMARKHGTFLNYATLEFGYVNDADNVVDDFRPPDAWPLVEVVDPAPKRGLHVKWFTCDEHDRWYNTHAARIPVAGGFRGMAKQVYAHRQEVGRHPDLALMDPRGGHHRMVGTDGIEDWFQGFRKEGLVYTPAIAPSVENGTVQTLHDWLKPAYDPSKGELSVPRLRFCKRLRTLKNGPLWAYERFSWNPQASLRKREYEQAGKDWVDCDMYLAMWVERMKLTHRKLVAEDAPRRRSLAASYAVKPQVPGTSRGAGRPPWVPKSLARSYASRPGDWIHRIRS